MSNLDKYQNEAVRARSKSVLVIAPPGAGKTTTLHTLTGLIAAKSGFGC